ncbi:MAG TPA: hypothetical protein VFH89_07155 [Sphingomicrobium sp.]|nr:hypothetical protein [Sphingomicrobium sp.]
MRGKLFALTALLLTSTLAAEVADAKPKKDSPAEQPKPQSRQPAGPQPRPDVSPPTPAPPAAYGYPALPPAAYSPPAPAAGTKPFTQKQKECRIKVACPMVLGTPCPACP